MLGLRGTQKRKREYARLLLHRLGGFFRRAACCARRASVGRPDLASQQVTLVGAAPTHYSILQAAVSPPGNFASRNAQVPRPETSSRTAELDPIDHRNREGRVGYGKADAAEFAGLCAPWPRGRWQRVRRRRETLDQVREQRVLLDHSRHSPRPVNSVTLASVKTPKVMALRGVAGVTLISVRGRGGGPEPLCDGTEARSTAISSREAGAG